MDMSDHDIFGITQVVLQFISTLDHCGAVTLSRSQRSDGSNEAEPFNFAMSPCPDLTMFTVEKEYH
jgi:hypothetical protein